MRTMQRVVATVGLTLMTGGMLGVSATAASAAPSEEKASQQSVERHRDHDRDRGGRFDRDRDRTRTYGWFPSRDTCRIAAWVGERRGKFDDPRCIRIGRGYILRAEPNHHRWGRGR